MDSWSKNMDNNEAAEYDSNNNNNNETTTSIIMIRMWTEKVNNYVSNLRKRRGSTGIEVDELL